MKMMQREKNYFKRAENSSNIKLKVFFGTDATCVRNDSYILMPRYYLQYAQRM